MIDRKTEEPLHPHELPATLIHDLRTPLNQIIGYSEMLIELATEPGSEAFKPDLERIRKAGDELLAVINDNFRPCGALELRSTPPDLLPEYVPVEDLDGLAAKSEIRGEASFPQEEAQRFVLVVDDNEANRDTLSRRLERLGYVVRVATSGAQAIEVLLLGACDLVLLDIMMPEMDGYQVLQRIKASPQLQSIPVVMVSALSELESVARCIEMGADDYLPKPFNLVILKARVRASLERKWARDHEAQLLAESETNYMRLQKLESLREDLTNMIIHDLRTPLTSVIAGIRTLAVVGELNPSQREMTDVAVSGAEGLLAAINDLLDVERADEDSMPLEYTIFTADELVTEALTQVASLVEAKELTVIHHIAHDLPPLQADERKLVRTLVNLLGNAIKFTPRHGTLSLDVRAEDFSAHFTVSDNGEGIPREALEGIFSKFGQVNHYEGDHPLGHGIGLYFCKMAIEAHNGSIWVESTLGEGSIFHFTIPLVGPES